MIEHLTDVEKENLTSAEKQIKNLKEQIEKKQNRLKQIQAKEKEKARKARTKRLIEVGAVVEKYTGEITSLESFERYVRQYANAIKANQKKSCKMYNNSEV